MTGNASTVRRAETPRTFGAAASAWKVIGLAGTVVGVLDLAYAIVVYSPHHPIHTPQTIAAGVLGRRSFEGGLRTAALGVFLHFVIAFVAAAAFYVGSRYMRVLTERPFVCGILYGAWVYIFMHYVVLPFSALHPAHGLPTPYKLAEFVEHWFFVGIPIAYIAAKYGALPARFQRKV